jgi:hypothetical protein
MSISLVYVLEALRVFPRAAAAVAVAVPWTRT